VIDAEQTDHIFESHPTISASLAMGEESAEEEVLTNRQMGEETGVLEHIAHLTPVGLHEDARGGVQHDAAVEDDPAALRPQEAGNGMEHRRLAGARRTEQRGGAAVGAKGNVDGEIA
jgi:hypothetical protein